MIVKFFLTALFIVSTCGDFIPSLMIDDFEHPPMMATGIILPTSEFPVKATTTIVGSMLGGTRSLFIYIESGPSGSLISSTIDDGNWNIESPGGAGGVVLLRYDASSGLSEVQRDGLQCEDVTVSGTSEGILLFGGVLDETKFKIFVYDAAGGIATVSEPVDYTSDGYYYFPFDSFMGEVDFTCVGAIEVAVTISSYSSVSFDVLTFGTYIPDPSNTSSPSKSPSRTPTRSRVASAGILGPTMSHSPTVVNAPHGECDDDLDCNFLEDSCTMAICLFSECHAQAISGVNGCCFVRDDCPFHNYECPDEVYCSDDGRCMSTSNCSSENVSPRGQSPADSSDSAAPLGIIFGSLSGILLLVFLICLLCFCLSCACCVYHKRTTTDHKSVYETMMGDL